LKISVVTQKWINNRGVEIYDTGHKIKQKTSRRIYEGGVKQQISNIYAYSPWVDVPEKPG
jgi:hypothetical protein